MNLKDSWKCKEIYIWFKKSKSTHWKLNVIKFQPKNKIFNVKSNSSEQNKLLETRKDKKNKKPPFKLLLNLSTSSSLLMS